MLTIGEKSLAPDLVIFDKDGTLIDFKRLWHAWYRLLLAELARHVRLDDTLLHHLSQTLGYNPVQDSWHSEGPLTLATISEIRLLIAGVLYAHHLCTWNQAKELIADIENKVRSELPLHELVQPIGDARGLLAKIRQKGIKTAVATGDIRPITEISLRVARIDDMFDMVVCAEEGVLVKPAADMVLAICSGVHVSPQKSIVIGDSVDDMLMARAAGVMAAVGVTSGASPLQVLAPYADILIDNIHEIQVA